MKTLRNIFIGVIIMMFVLFFIYNFYLTNQDQKIFVNSSYEGIILDIRKVEGRRGFPDIKINNDWLLLGMREEKIINYIQVGDSIVKKSGTETIKVFRKDKRGRWYVKEFK